jgi:hypothetical protein
MSAKKTTSSSTSGKSSRKSGLSGVSGIAEKGRQAPANVSRPGLRGVMGPDDFQPNAWPHSREMPQSPKRSNVGLQLPAEMYTRVKSYAFNGPPRERKVSRYIYDGVRALEALESQMIEDAGDGDARTIDPHGRDIPELIRDAIAALREKEGWDDAAADKA